MSSPVPSLRARLASEGKLTLAIRVVPRAARTEWAGELTDGSYKIRLHALPEKGRANEELIRFLASEFSLPKSHVELVAGQTSQHKQVRLLSPQSR